MRYIKKIMAVLLTVVVVVTFTGCTNESNLAAKKLKVEEETTITIWYNDESYSEYLNFVAQEFHRVNELVTINAVFINSEEYLENIYEESIKNDNAPDVFLMSSDYVEKAYLMGLMLENTSFEDLKVNEVYGDAAITACSYRNKLYGYPVTFNTAVMVYNTKYTGPVDTFTQLTEYSDNYQVTEDNEEVEMIVNWDVSSMFLNYPLAGSYISYGGESAEEETRVILDDENIKLAMTEYAKLKDAYGIDRQQVSQDNCVEMFANNKLLYTIVDSNHLSIIDQSEVSYDVCKIPALNSQLTSGTLSTTTMAVVNPYSSNLEAAKAGAMAISYDYATEIEAFAGLMCARGDYKKEKNQSAYENLHKIYSESMVKAKYIGIGDLYMRYDIMIHQIWDGTDVDIAYEEFKTNINNLN